MKLKISQEYFPKSGRR